MDAPLDYAQDGAIVTLTLNAPDIRNAISGADMIDALVEACERMNADMSVRAAILTGAGSAFSSGGNVKKMADGGIRGIRFTLFDPKTAVTGFDMIEPLAERVKDLGWHVQLHFRGDQIVEQEGLLKRISAPIVFDHLGRIPQPAGVKHPAFDIIRRLVDKGRTWVK